MRFKVVVTKVEVAELWVRGTDEEAAAQKVKEELKTMWAYAGHWDRKATEVDVMVAPSGPMLPKLNDAAAELGISYGTLHVDEGRRYPINQCRYSQVHLRATLTAFIEANTHR